MTRRDVEFILSICTRPSMYWPELTSFVDVLAFVCGTTHSVDRGRDFGDFPAFVAQRNNVGQSEWVQSLIDRYREFDVHDACLQFRELVREWSESTESLSDE